ncbi:hypothetical protein HPB50_019618 [Hyalomma asiaticum]|uniref:Uncharacterized protein n=1 Tax=Hyalomma asiaticum TaxID=266040 RepID=A0ACB7RQ12_HYAAI|nr:hypothetical protein HPB50_019618 [Hyalomma asiaticum]
MPMLLTHNDALRSLRIERSQYSYKEPCKCKADLPDCTDRPLRYLTDECPDLDLLTEGISQNKRLTELTIDLSSSSLPKCQRFFMALRENKVLQRVTVTRLRSADAFEVCQLIRQNGVQERVHLTWPITVTAPVQAAVRGLYLSSACIDCTDSQNRILQHGGLNWLPVWKHTRDLSLRLHCDQLVSGYAHLLSYLNVTIDLRNLCLNIEGRIADKRLRQNLMMTLLGNPGLRKLKIVGGLVVDRDEVRDFAKALCFNDSLFDFSLFRDTTQESSDVVPIESILSHMSYLVTRNRTLCFLGHDKVPNSSDFQAVHRAVRRNRALAMRAAHFVVGVDKSDYCAKALSLVRNSQQLLFDVMRLAAIGEGEAAARIQRILTRQE